MSQMSADSMQQPNDDDEILRRGPRKLWQGNPERDAQTYSIIGAAMEVHQQLGAGFLEGVYQDALQIELIARSIPFNREHAVPVTYKGFVLGTSYRVDFLCFDSVLVELKAKGNQSADWSGRSPSDPLPQSNGSQPSNTDQFRGAAPRIQKAGPQHDGHGRRAQMKLVRF
jgi:GxxExxY protein